MRLLSSMRRRFPAPLAILGCLPFFLIACGQDAQNHTGNTGGSSAQGGAGGSSAQGGAGGSSAQGGTGGSSNSIDYVQAACSATAVDHSAACPAPCAIGVDLEISCNDDKFAAPGLRVAPSPDATWLVTSSQRDRMLLRADAAGVTRVGDDVLPKEFLNNFIFLGLSPTGALHLMRATSSPWYDIAVQHLVQQGSAWESTTVVAASKSTVSSPKALEVGSDGVPHIWFGSSKDDVIHHATQDTAGKWSDTVMPIPDGAQSVRFALTADGQPAAFGFVGAYDKYKLWSFVGGQEQTFGSSSGLSYVSYALAHGPLVATGPAFAAAVQHKDAIHVVWPQGAASQEIVLPNTPELLGFCGSGHCRDTCTEKTTGVDTRATALARTDDGTLWVAYVLMNVDAVYRYQIEGGCNTEIECSHCTAQVEEDKGSSTLHVVRVRTDGSPPQEVLTLPTARFAVGYSNTEGESRTIDARGFGKDLVIGLRTAEAPAPFKVAKVRLLRIDTTKLAP